MAVHQLEQMRILHAFGELAAEDGCERATSERVAALVGVSTHSLHEQLGDREDALTRGFEVAVARASSRVGGACAGQVGEQRVRAGCAALLSFVEQEPELIALALGRLQLLQQQGQPISQLLEPAVQMIMQGCEGAGPAQGPSLAAA
jgi:AcrR family transcriptional regulator